MEMYQCPACEYKNGDKPPVEKHIVDTHTKFKIKVIDHVF
jgi:hypothetical protein